MPRHVAERCWTRPSGSTPSPPSSPTAKSVLFLGRHAGYPVALEGALKLKELAYIHAEGFAAGELKHGPIALVEDRLPVFVRRAAARAGTSLHDKMVSGIQEVRARGARTIVLAEEGDDEVAPYADELIRLPQVPTLLQPMVAVVPLQLFACELATADGPRRRPAAQPGQVRHRRVTADDPRASASTWSTSRASARPWSARPALRDAAVHAGRAGAAAGLAGRPVRGQGGAGQGARGADRDALAGRRDRQRGRPATRASTIRGSVQARADELGVASVHVSLSHDAGIASAVVVLET